MLPVSGLGSLALMGHRNSSEFSLVLNVCVSTTLERHNFVSVELRAERYLILGLSKYEEHGSAIEIVET